MSQQEDDLRALAKIMDFVRGISIAIVAANILWFTGIAVVRSNWFVITVYRILNNLNTECGIFQNPNNAKWFALLLLAISCFGTRGVKSESIKWRHVAAALALGLALFHRLLVDARQGMDCLVYRIDRPRICGVAFRRRVGGAHTAWQLNG